MSDVTDVKISGGEVTFRALDTVARGLRSQLHEGQEEIGELASCGS